MTVMDIHTFAAQNKPVFTIDKKTNEMVRGDIISFTTKLSELNKATVIIAKDNGGIITVSEKEVFKTPSEALANRFVD